MIVSLLAILKAGGAYVPLDPEYPSQRLQNIVDDANIALLLTQTDVADKHSLSVKKLCVDDVAQQSQIDACADTNLGQLSLSPDDLAYVIYTSGSTGKPKGVMLEHRGLCNLSKAQQQLLSVNSDSRVLQFASVSFDAATWEWCMALTNGATLVLANESTIKTPNLLSELVRNENVTHATLPPALLPLLPIEQWLGTSTIVVAGDHCPQGEAMRWSKGRTFINAYGPSETTICATLGHFSTAPLDGDDKANTQHQLHIGQPLPNVQVYVLNAHLVEVPIGATGELYVGGVGLARGYLGREELNKNAFVENPFFEQGGLHTSQQLYKTGDLVRGLPDGNLQFVGRVDHQVKVRGFRIELGEIEHALVQQAQVNEAVVVVDSTAAGDKRLLAYVVVEQSLIQESEIRQALTDQLVNAGVENHDAEISQEQIMAYFNANLAKQLQHNLRQSLPDYMVPMFILPLEALPLNANAKVDRTALPSINLQDQSVVYVAPSNEIEEVLCQMWQDLLNIEKVGVNDNFFALGGHSLLAVQLLSKVNDHFKIELSLQALFGVNTLLELANAVEQQAPTMTEDTMSRMDDLLAELELGEFE